ncbi:Mobile element protein (plasmid) [Sinorhizobium fredii CCBAU 25509]|uniref:Uncharacterized protein n=2 Tax=Sinorhizobium TaxID=28105 RepID=I3XHI2_SINF2|nr:hypothetical protein USDA257_p06230 [Sinorhizobium fredii USDA 257]AWM29776.1 Mobile element protein [Sinorhizobium fredii CCBAU 25509]GEC35801.1 hypothetical protein EFR01_59720 [Sinorhizobium fredii]GLS09498.1 hypothetical protein GCM10007864_31280 [Sinorhizobium fredii]
MDRKNARKYVERGLEAPKYGQRKQNTMFGDRLATYLRERVKACPVRTARRLFREISGLDRFCSYTALSGLTR